MTEYELTIIYHREPGEERSSSVSIGSIVARYADHPTKDRAVMYAIVKAVISLLEHRKDGKHYHSSTSHRMSPHR